MSLAVDWANQVVESTASITDIVAFKAALRELEDDAVGMLYPPIITYKRLDLGGGAYMHAVDFINGYQLKFPAPGNYTVIGNINAVIVPVAGVFVDRVKAAAFATVAGESAALSPGDLVAVAAAVLAALQAATIPVNMVQVKGQALSGAGSESDPWGP